MRAENSCYRLIISDDEALFASYIALRERPRVITVLDGGLKKRYPEPRVRVEESQAAMRILGCEYEHLGFKCAIEDWTPVAIRIRDERGVERVWAPMPEPCGHRHHNMVARVAIDVFGIDRVGFYSTYRTEPSGWPIRTTHGFRVEEQRGWPELKRAALACYPSQSQKADTGMHFDRPLDEFEASAIRLNLGGGLNPITGFVNLDKSNGWMFEDGLGCYPDGSVEAITISHTLMYVAPDDWPYVFHELARVLRPGGLLRITEDAIGAPGSSRPVRRPGAQLETTAELVLDHVAWAGLAGEVVSENESADETLIQQNYGREPDVFHVEARAPVRVEAVA